MAKENKSCPSYDYGICNTYPAMETVKCENVNEKCRWRDFDFTKTSYEEYIKGGRTMSKIEWTQETWNIITGCTKHSEGCLNCYAEKMHKRLTAMGQEKYKIPFEGVIFHYEEFRRNLGKKPKMFFVNSMSDTFHEKIAGEPIAKILDFCKKNYQHIFQILTKRAERVTGFTYPENVWLGVTVEKAKYKSRMDYLKNTNAKVKFLSCEPLLEDLGVLDLKGINWVIAGGESGRNARPCEPDWVRNIQKQCKEQGVPFFFKQWGEWLPEVNNEFTFENLLTQKNSFCVQNGKFFKRTGKAKSGALLDGVEYKEFPEIAEVQQCRLKH